MKASIEDQHRLVALQDLDTELAKVAHKRKTLPEHVQLAELVASKDSLDARLVAAQTRLGDADLALQRAQEDLVPVRQRMERDQALIDAGANNDAKALQALLSEVEHLKRRLSNLEDLELEAMEEQEVAATLCQHCAAEKAEFMPTVREVKARREQLMAQCDVEMANLSQQRAAAAESVPMELLTIYAKIATRTGGLAVAKMVQKKCTGCGMEADAVALQKYLDAPADELVRCEECDRILVRA